ncbi:MAG TPA: hypothetical protein VFM18_21885 [Methanosarcina sp.]|nr:hypothetical protein [Methanosarcina sp.]
MTNELTKQVARSYEEWILDPDHVSTIPSAYQAGVASQSAKIAELLKENEALRLQVNPEMVDHYQHLMEEVERLKKYDSAWAQDFNEKHKQLQSAQLDNKRLRDALQEIALWYKPVIDDISIAKKALSTPLDTSAADELLARVKELKESSAKMYERVKQVFIKHQREREEYFNKLTAAHKALEEARALVQMIPAKEISERKMLVQQIEATIDALLGKEQKEKR